MKLSGSQLLPLGWLPSSHQTAFSASRPLLGAGAGKERCGGQTQTCAVTRNAERPATGPRSSATELQQGRQPTEPVVGGRPARPSTSPLSFPSRDPSTCQSFYLGKSLSLVAFGNIYFCCYCCSVAQLCLILCDPMDCSRPGFPVLHY